MLRLSYCNKNEDDRRFCRNIISNLLKIVLFKIAANLLWLRPFENRKMMIQFCDQLRFDCIAFVSKIVRFDYSNESY